MIGNKCTLNLSKTAIPTTAQPEGKFSIQRYRSGGYQKFFTKYFLQCNTNA